MLQTNEFRWQLAAKAYNSDLIDAQQFIAAMTIWTNAPEQSIVDILIDQNSLSRSDIELLSAIDERRQDVLTLVPHDASSFRPTDTRLMPSGTHRYGGEVTGSDSAVRATLQFELVEPIAQGGIGDIQLAVDSQLNRQVALKRLQSHYRLDPNAALRLVQEAEITAQLEHPAIVPIYHFGFAEDGQPFYCMRLIKGRNLKDKVRELFENQQTASSHPAAISLDFRRLLAGFVTICRAVQHAHSHHIIHRDIKPANIIVGDHGEPVLIDWGLAKRLEQGSQTAGSNEERGGDAQSGTDRPQQQLTLDGITVGTPAFMSPEQATGEQNIGPSSDIFGLGATLYYLLTNHAPYSGATVGETLSQACQCSWASIQSYDIGVPPALIAICGRAMAAATTDRYESAEALADDVERWLANESVSVFRDSLGTQVRRWLAKHHSTAVGLAVTTASIVLGAVVFSAYTTTVNHALNKAVQDQHAAQKLAIQHADLAVSSLRTVTLDIQRKLQSVPAAQSVRTRLLETALDGLSKVSSSLAESSELDTYMVIAHRELGDLFLEVGDIGPRKGLETARREFEAARRIAVKIVMRSPGDIEAQRQYVMCLQRQAALERVDGTVTNEQTIYQEAHSILEQLYVQAPHDETVLRSLGVSHNLQGELAVRMGDIEKSGEHFNAALHIFEDQWNRGISHPDLERDRIITLNKMGNYLRVAGQLREAEQYFLQSLELSRTRSERLPDDFNALRDLSTVYFYLGQVCQNDGRAAESLVYMRSSADIDYRRFLLDPTNTLAARDFVQSSNSLATALKHRGESVEAKQRLMVAIEVGGRLLAVDSNETAALRDIAYSHSDLGDLQRIDEPLLALSNYDMCLKLMQQVAESDPDNPRGKSDMAYALGKRASGLVQLDRFEEAIQAYESAIRLQRLRAQVHPESIAVQSGMMVLQLGRMDAWLKNHQTETANLHTAELQQAIDQLLQSAPDHAEVRVTQVRTLLQLGQVAQSVGDFDRAKQFLAQAKSQFADLVLREQLSADDTILSQEIQASIDAINALPTR